MDDSTVERTYHQTSAPYVLPNDASEHERLEWQAKAVNAMMHDQPNHAPLTNPKKILDVGCGTGILTSYFARTYDHSADEVIGVDLSPVPERAEPTKAIFLQGTFRDLAKQNELLVKGDFDYVFSRLLLFGMDDWPGYVAQAKDLLRPGGWLEVQEPCLTWYDENKNRISDSWQWLEDQVAAMLGRGLDLRCAPQLSNWLEAAGFVDVHVKEFRWVCGKWKGHPETDMIGEFSSTTLKYVNAVAYKKVLTASKTPEELAAGEKQMLANFTWPDEGQHIPFYVVYGRKP